MKKEPTTVGYESDKQRYPWFKTAYVLSSLAIGLIAATQVFAREFEYHEVLGPHIRHVYFPTMFFVWLREWGGG